MARNIDELPKAKATNDAYTGMLGLSLIALLVGCGVLYMDYAQYSEKPPQKVDVTSVKPRADRDPGEARDQSKKDAPAEEGKEAAKEEAPEGKKG